MIDVIDRGRVIDKVFKFKLTTELYLSISSIYFNEYCLNMISQWSYYDTCFLCKNLF